MSRGLDAASFAANVEEAISLIADAFQTHGVAHALIGGMAIAYRANPRATMDVDFIVAANALQLERVVDDLVSHGFSPESQEILKQWSEDRLAVLWFENVRVDWLRPVLPVYQHVVDRAESLSAFGKPLSVATVEGLVICKLLADRPQDRADIAALVDTYRDRLNMNDIEQEWATIGEPDAPQLLALRALVDNPDSAR